MIDSLPINPTGGGAPPSSNRPSLESLNKEGGAENAFATALAQSTDNTESLKQEAAGDGLSAPSDQISKEDEASANPAPDATNAVDITALIAQMMADSQVAPTIAASMSPALDGTDGTDGTVGTDGTAVAVGMRVKFAGDESPQQRDVMPVSAENSPLVPTQPALGSDERLSKMAASPVIANAGKALSGQLSDDVQARGGTTPMPSQTAQHGLRDPSEIETGRANPGDTGKGVEERQTTALQTDTTANSGGSSVGTIQSVPAFISAGIGAKVETVFLIPAHVENSSWSKDFGEHVIRLAMKGEPSAEIHLNPPDWGPIRVSIEMNGTDASLRFLADHPHTREALEGALPRLREIFAANSLTVSDANVSDQSLSQHSAESHQQKHGRKEQDSDTRIFAGVNSSPLPATTTNRALGRSKVDLFA
jgi:flagellar hook-length control protein FliK